MQSMFLRLLANSAFSDVTLVADGFSLACHKLVLSACSGYFEGVLLDHQHPHPIVVLHDMSAAVLQALVTFMYSGEIRLPQDELSMFLQAAKTLKVKGLTEGESNGNEATCSPATRLPVSAKRKLPELCPPTSEGVMTLLKRPCAPRATSPKGLSVQLATSSDVGLAQDENTRVNASVDVMTDSPEGSESPPSLENCQRKLEQDMELVFSEDVDDTTPGSDSVTSPLDPNSYPTLSEAPCPSSTLSSAGQASSPPWKNPKWSGLLPENKVLEAMGNMLDVPTLAAKLMKNLFTEEERINSNTTGDHGKQIFDKEKMELIRSIALHVSEVSEDDSTACDELWVRCKMKIDKWNRDLRYARKKKDKDSGVSAVKQENAALAEEEVEKNTDAVSSPLQTDQCITVRERKSVDREPASGANAVLRGADSAAEKITPGTQHASPPRAASSSENSSVVSGELAACRPDLLASRRLFVSNSASMDA